MEEEKKIIMLCPSCGKEAAWVPNEVVYAGRRYVSKAGNYMCYYCKDCDYMVGCHGNTRRPLGTMIGKEMRGLRKAVHAKIDPLWQSGKITRGHLYNFISQQIGRQYHTGESDEETCRKVLAIDWAKLEVFNKKFKHLT